ARHKLAGRPPGAADEEGVALSAFASFYRGAEQGRFPKLNDRQDLWRLLVTITARKAMGLIDHENSLQNGGRVRGTRQSPGASARWPAASQRRSSPPRWPRSIAGCWGSWATPSCRRSPSGRWKATPTTRSPPCSAACRGRWSASSRESASCGAARGGPD